MEVFKRRNSASYIDRFEVSLINNDIKEIDNSMVKTLVDSMPRYSRSYSDNLYNLYSIPGDSVPVLKKIRGIRNVVLQERDGGNLEQLEKVIVGLINDKDNEDIFWKLKTGLLSVKIDDGIQGDEDRETENTGKDTLNNVIPASLYNAEIAFNPWKWEFLSQPGRYNYVIESIVPFEEEFAYAISFEGKKNKGFRGMVYISDETYAILRIEYSLKKVREIGGMALLGVTFSYLDDSGVLLFSRDENGYFLKYEMTSISNSYGLNRSFSFIRKEKRPVFRKKLNEIKLDAFITGREDISRETLVINRVAADKNEFAGIREKLAAPEYISTYSDSIWRGYSIIEPTRQMKEYRARNAKR
jgi:hypothetical protein